MPVLHRLRAARLTPVLALLAYLLVVGSTLAAPLLQPGAFAVLCSAAAGTSDDGAADGDRLIACALCLPLAAAPNTKGPQPPVPANAQGWVARADSPLIGPPGANLPPARGPPAV